MSQSFEDLAFEYMFSGMAELKSWATNDLVALSLLVDTELQSRAYDASNDHE